MTKIIKLFYLLIFVFILSMPVFSQGYRIEVKIEGIRDTSIYLAYHFGDKKLIQDTLYLDKHGKGSGIFSFNGYNRFAQIYEVHRINPE